MWPWCPSSTLSMSGNAQMQCLGQSLCCNAPQRCPFVLAFHAQVSPSLWAQKVMHCSRVNRRHERTRISWVSHWIVGGAVTAVPLTVWLGLRGGQGNYLPSYSSLQQLPSCASDYLEVQAGRSCLSVLFPVFMPQIFHCTVPGE